MRNAFRICRCGKPLKAIADHELPDEPVKGASFDEIWAWAERQVAAPFNRTDLESIACVQSKLLARADVPANLAFLLGVDTDIPVIALVETDDLLVGMERLAPYAKGNRDLDLDSSLTGMEVMQMLLVIGLVAKRTFAAIFVEYERRCECCKQSPDTWLDDLARHRAAVLAEWKVGIDRAEQRIRELVAAGDFEQLAETGARIDRMPEVSP